MCIPLLVDLFKGLLEAEPHEKTEERKGYRNSYKTRTQVTRAGAQSPDGPLTLMAAPGATTPKASPMKSSKLLLRPATRRLLVTSLFQEPPRKTRLESSLLAGPGDRPWRERLRG